MYDMRITDKYELVELIRRMLANMESTVRITEDESHIYFNGVALEGVVPVEWRFTFPVDAQSAGLMQWEVEDLERWAHSLGKMTAGAPAQFEAAIEAITTVIYRLTQWDVTKLLEVLETDED